MLSVATLSQRDVLLEDILGQVQAKPASTADGQQPSGRQPRKRRRCNAANGSYAGGGTPGGVADSPSAPAAVKESSSGRSRFSREQQRMHMVGYLMMMMIWACCAYAQYT